MIWSVALKGNLGDLEELSKACVSDDLKIQKEGEEFVLKTLRFEALTDSKDVLGLARELLSSINGSARLTIGMREPITTNTVHRINERGGRDTFYSADPIELKLTVQGVATLVRGSDGKTEINYPAGPVPRWTNLALKDENVAKVLRLFGASKNDWTDLYRIFEVIKKDLGGEEIFWDKGWVAKKAVENFRHTANSPAASGDQSRHGVGQPGPKNPMSLREAKSLIEAIVLNWLRYKEVP